MASRGCSHTTSSNRDFYQILGITRSASMKSIKSAYRKKEKLYHPGMFIIVLI